MATRIHVLVCSTRPGRKGHAIAQWFLSEAQRHAGAQPVLVDLASFGLPVFDEPKHPRLQQYEHEHTRAWSRSVQAADAFVFVTPEYNYGPPPSLLNALNYLSAEWHYKPVAFVSYGGLSGGVRGVQVSKLVATTLRMVPVLESVALPNFTAQIDADGRFTGTEAQAEAVGPLVRELCRVEAALRPLRQVAAR